MLIEIHPKLPMRKKSITKDFYLHQLGFELVGHADHEGYLILAKDNIQLHFFEFAALKPKQNYGQIYIWTDRIEQLYHSFLANQVNIPPHGVLHRKPWGHQEFSILDPDNNLLTFGQES